MVSSGNWWGRNANAIRTRWSFRTRTWRVQAQEAADQVLVMSPNRWCVLQPMSPKSSHHTVSAVVSVCTVCSDITQTSFLSALVVAAVLLVISYVVNKSIISKAHNSRKTDHIAPQSVVKWLFSLSFELSVMCFQSQWLAEHPTIGCMGGTAAWAEWAMVHPKFWLGGPQYIWPRH